MVTVFDSEYSRIAVNDAFHVPAEKVRVVYAGVGAWLGPISRK